MICEVCKKEIKEGEIIAEVNDTKVHYMMCKDYLNDLPLNESDQLADVQLLSD